VYRKIEQQPVYRMPKYLPVRLAVLLVMMIGAGGLFGFVSPKFEPQWQDPVPFVRAAVGMNENGSGEGVKRIGYGDNDERLGGGFINDNSPVFYAASSQGHYWRGETKNFYTGRGWDTTTPKKSKEMLYADKGAGVAEFEQLEAEVVFVEESSTLIDHLLYPGELQLTDQIMNVDLFQDTYTGKASTYQGSDPIKLENYQYTYLYPSFQVEGLRSSSEQDPEDIQKYYTQLPEGLPDRVRELAVEITSEEENRYDRAKAVESYFSLANFHYETQDVPVPSEGQDYVDQFLFETKRGYCDNFSTSMIVLLRTLDIPARWAKGFTQGEVVETLDDSRDVYKVTNANAHSWVEVYFPEVGWVPFEPTRGFDHAYEFVEPEVETENLDEETPLEKEEPEPEVEEAFAEIEEDDDDEQSSAGGSSTNNRVIPGGPWILVGLLIVALLFAFIKNKRIVQFYTLQTFSRRKDEEVFLQAYDRLLWLLKYVGCGRKSGETLREYAARIDKEFGATEMMSLTKEYERIMYGGQSIGTSWTAQKTNWIALVRKIDS
jgi:transglutaminase-like putative cysteine protease